jgi:DNA-nicking Smr family endonuclease
MTRRFFELADHGLWDDVARSISPLKKSGRSAKLNSTSSIATAKRSAPAFAALKLRAPGLSVAPPAVVNRPMGPKPIPALARFDRKTEQRLTRGKVEIEGRIDLHGETLEMARFKLLGYITRERGLGTRLVLVITGKGASPFASHTLHGSRHFDAPEREGKLRRAFPHWLQEAVFRDHVTGFQPAHPKHGGGGAFYVKLRRNREA